MSLPIHVDAYSGYKPNERPRQFTLDEVVYEIAAVLDQWYEPSATYFKVRSTEGKTYLLRYDEEADDWTLQSGFDGDELLARPGTGMACYFFILAVQFTTTVIGDSPDCSITVFTMNCCPSSVTSYCCLNNPP